MDELQTQLTLGMVVPYILQWLKSQSWFPLLNLKGGALNRSIAAVVALASGFGVASHFDSAGGVLTITGLTFANIQQGVLHSIMAYALQHSVYKVAISPPLPGAEQAAKRDAQNSKG